MLWAVYASAVAVAANSGDALFTGGGLEAVVVRGYVEARGSYTDAETTHWATTERFRPTMKVYLWDRVRLTATGEARLDQGRYDNGEFLRAFEPILPSDLSGNQTVTLEEVIDTCQWDIDLDRTYDELGDVASLERLYLDINTSAFDLRLGRQSVNWGSALFLNPSDIFQQVLLAEPWQERAGIDAARVNIPVGERARVTALVGALSSRTVDLSGGGTTPGIDLSSYDSVRGAVKGTVNVSATDISALVSTDGERHFAGIDLKGDLTGAVPLGWWVEGVYQLDTDGTTSEGAPKIAVGADYSFDVLNRLYIAGQFYYDGTGEIPALYDWNSRQDPALAAITPCDDEDFEDFPSVEPPDEYRLTLGRYYALNVIQLEAGDYLTLTNTVTMNLADRTGLLFPQAAYDLGSRVTLNAGVQYLFGSDGEFSPPDYQLFIGGVDLAPLQPTVTGLAWVRVNI